MPNQEEILRRRIGFCVERKNAQWCSYKDRWNYPGKDNHACLFRASRRQIKMDSIGHRLRTFRTIELMFKELKSRYALDALDTKNPLIIEALIWVAILTLLVSRRTYFNVRKIHPGKNIVRFTQLRWSIIFAENADDQLTLILRYLGITRTWETLAGVYDSQALDPHVNRERFRAEWWA